MWPHLPQRPCLCQHTRVVASQPACIISNDQHSARCRAAATRRRGGRERAEMLALELQQFGRREALRGGERLASREMRRHELQVRLGDLEEVAEHALVANAERADAGGLPLAGLEGREEPLRIGAKRTQPVDLVVGTGAKPSSSTETPRIRADRPTILTRVSTS